MRIVLYRLMRLEQMALGLSSLNMEQIRIERCIHSVHGKKPYYLDHEQLDALTLLHEGYSIAAVAGRFFSSGTFISFTELRRLLKFLANEGIAANSQLKEYFEDSQTETSGLFENLTNFIFGSKEEAIKVKEELRALPFFRMLTPKMFNLMWSQAKVVEVPAKTMICRAGATDRKLFVLLRGHAQVSMTTANSKRQHLATLAQGSVFGETGFFLGEPRRADVITGESSLVLQIDYDIRKFNGVVQLDRAKELKNRLWVVHALLNSEFFRDLPSDCFDALVFSGKMRDFEKDKWICREGQAGSSCFIVVKGSAVVSRRNRAFRRLEQGDCFGEIALIMTGGRRSASVHSEADVMALEIEAPAFYNLLANNLELACQFETIALARINADRAV